MIVRLRETAMDKGHIVDVLRQGRKDLANPSTTFAMLLKLKWRLHQPAHCVDKEPCLIVETFERFSVPLFELWFVVPGVDLALSSIHE